MSDPGIERHGWNVYFHPVFDEQFEQQLLIVEALERKLIEGTMSPADYKTHVDVKLLDTLVELTEEIVPSDPLAKRFALKDELKSFSRVKRLRLLSRYRLFFNVFPDSKRIVFLWLGFPRRKGDKRRDCYEVFKKMVRSGKFPLAFGDLIQEINL